MGDEFNKPDANGSGTVSGGKDWGTHVHESKDPLDPWYSVTIEKTGEKFQGTGSPNEHIDKLLPDWMKKP